jgi:NAD(P)-dependent dehydrogenase (short-subunit alcohol dehydrogenase family)
VKGTAYKPEETVVLVTGASSGIGRACATRLHHRGYTVYGTSRRRAEESPPVANVPYPMIQMDVDDGVSVQAGVAHLLDEAGGVDVVINCAGFGIAGAIEETAIDEAKAQFETNLFGVLRVCQAVLPTMREQRQGRIINISSIAGIIGTPFQGLYSASKFALEGLSETLSAEVAPFRIQVVVVEPGDFQTEFTSRRRTTRGTGPGSPYHASFQRALRVIEADETGGGHPDQVARLVERIVRKRRPRLRYAVGPVAERLAAFLRPLVPGRWFARGIAAYYRI